MLDLNGILAVHTECYSLLNTFGDTTPVLGAKADASLNPLHSHTQPL